jgi:hypothetical protein
LLSFWRRRFWWCLWLVCWGHLQPASGEGRSGHVARLRRRSIEAVSYATLAMIPPLRTKKLGASVGMRKKRSSKLRSRERLASELRPYKSKEEPARHRGRPLQRHVNSLTPEGVSYKRTSGRAHRWHCKAAATGRSGNGLCEGSQAEPCATGVRGNIGDYFGVDLAATASITRRE